MKYFAEGRSETAAEHKPEYLRLSQAERETKRGRISMITVRAMQVKDAEQVSELERMIFFTAMELSGICGFTSLPNTVFLVAEEIIRS